MKANPGGTVTGDAIVGREAEIADLWHKLQTRSVVLSAERRVGKTSILRKMSESPHAGWAALLVYVESARHPIDCVEAIYREADRIALRSSRAKWLSRIRSSYEKLSDSQVGGWRLPRVQASWKVMLKELAADLAEHGDKSVLMMIDEFPLLVANIADDHGPSLAMEFLDTLREVRQAYEASGKIRFLFSGSIGLHLVLQHLKSSHGYKGSPTNDMAIKVLCGMSAEDTELMCQRYLDEENIVRHPKVDFAKQMFLCTDGLPLYVQYVCERMQSSGATKVAPSHIAPILKDMLESRELEWFKNAAQRIDTYYARLGAQDRAFGILGHLAHTDGLVPETSIFDYLKSQMPIASDRTVLDTLELLLDDNYLLRDTNGTERRYQFRYVLMRDWWRINRA